MGIYSISLGPVRCSVQLPALLRRRPVTPAVLSLQGLLPLQGRPRSLPLASGAAAATPRRRQAPTGSQLAPPEAATAAALASAACSRSCPLSKHFSAR